MMKKNADSQILLGGEGLNQKLKFFCLKNVPIERRVEQTGATQAYHRQGSGGRALGDLLCSLQSNFSDFLKKHRHFNEVWITFRTFVEPLKKIADLEAG